MKEHKQQEALITYIKLKYPKVRYCASLGGQYQKYESQKRKAKATGYVRGFPDLQVTEARKNYYGLFIELKIKTGRLSKEQQIWLEDLSERGYYAVCCKGLEAAMDVVDWYLNDKE